MKLLHCADLHLDSPMRANLDAVKSKERRLELLDTFSRMVDFAREEAVSAILIAGDLFDSSNVSRTAMNAFLRQIDSHSDIDFYYLRGNHDALCFPVSEGLPDNLKLFDDEWTEYVLSENEHLRIVLKGVEFNGIYEGSIYDCLKLKAHDFNILMLHGQTVKHNMGDKTEYIHTERLRNRGIDYMALGHVHAYSREEIDNRGVYCFPGCLEGRGFDECGEHGFVLVDINEETGEWADCFVPFAKRQLCELYVDVSGCLNSDEMTDRVKAAIRDAGYNRENLYKIILTGKIDVNCEKDTEYILHNISDLYFVKIKDETKMEVDFRMYAFDESLKGEFIRNVYASELSEEEKGEVIHYGLMALSGEDILE